MLATKGYISRMDIRAVDLNLLPVLDALLRFRSATRAAAELDMSQSALSSALARLRLLLGDELFVRTGRGLRPTARAQALAGPVSEILERVRADILPAAAFDPKSADCEFRIAHTDVGAYVLWPRIVKRVREAAPGVRLVLKVQGTSNLSEELADGRVDLAVGSFAALSETLFQQRLFDRRFVGVVTEGHGLARKRLTLKDLAVTPQIVVNLSSGIHSHIDEALRAAGLKRQDTIELASYLMVPPLLDQGDFLAVIPAQLAEAFARRWPFVILALPFPELPSSTIRMHWHRRAHADAGNQWLRGLVADELAVDCSD